MIYVNIPLFRVKELVITDRKTPVAGQVNVNGDQQRRSFKF